MARILVLYASTHGHTAKIAARIASVLEDDGATVDLHQLGANETHPAPPDYDAVILGASIHAGHHQHALVKWAERHHTALGLTPSALFSVCLTASDDTEESRAATSGPVGARARCDAHPRGHAGLKRPAPAPKVIVQAQASEIEAMRPPRWLRRRAGSDRLVAADEAIHRHPR